MANTRSIKRKFTPEFPPDLCRDVFSRLPVKSIFRLSCVSKTWRSVIHDPLFVQSYGKRAGTQISVLRSNSVTLELAIRCNKTFKVKSDQETQKIEEDIPSTWRVINGADGLLLLESQWRRNKLVLWNPSIRRFRILARPPETSQALKKFDLGIAFDPSIEDYKVVNAVFEAPKEPDNVHSVSIYTLGTNSWKTIPFRASNYDRMPRIFNPVYDKNRRESVSFRGGLYFLAWDRYEDDTWEKVVVSFDLRREEFSAAKLPEIIGGYENDDRMVLKCGNQGSLLSLAHIRSNQVSIWWAEGEGGDVTWTMVYELRPTLSRSVGSRVIGSMRDVLNVEFDCVLVEFEGCVISYDLKAIEAEIVFTKRRASSNIVYVSHYVESLMLLPF